MFKFLKGSVAGSGAGIKDFPYTIGEPYSSAWGSWSHYRGINKDDGSPVSIFSLSGSNNQDRHLAAGRNGVKRLKTVRHPNILSFLHSTEAELFDGSTSKITIYIVTEPVMPLWEKIKELDLEGKQRDEYFAWGLHQISKAVSFLNNDCKLVHGNVCVDSVVVTQTLDWKLHALDVSSQFNANSDLSNSPIRQFDRLIGYPYKPLELVMSDWLAKKKLLPWSIDSWGFGCLICELFSGSRLTRLKDLRNTDSIPESLLPDYCWLFTVLASHRLNPSKLVDDNEYFHNKLVETIQFMEILNLKDSAEKDSFFRKLPNLAEQLPRQVVLKKLLPLLSSALEFGSAAASALTPLFKISSWLPAEEFNVKILPTIVKLFASNDPAIRVGLLQHIDQFGESLSALVVDEQLSRRTISGPLRKYLSNLQLSCGDVDNLNGGAQLIPGNAGLLGWAMSSLTLKGKPSDHAPIASASANTSLPSASKEEDDDLWGPIAVPPPKSAVKSVDTKSDDLWGSIAAPPPKAAPRHRRRQR